MNDGLVDIHLTAGDRLPNWGLAQHGGPLGESSASDESISFPANGATWVFEAARKLDALARRQTGWDSYGGLPLKPDARRLTVDVLKWLRKSPLPVPYVVLGSGGTVHLEWRLAGKELEIELCDGEELAYLKVAADGKLEEGEAKTSLQSKVRNLSAWLVER